MDFADSAPWGGVQVIEGRKSVMMFDFCFLFGFLKVCFYTALGLLFPFQLGGPDEHQPQVTKHIENNGLR